MTPTCETLRSLVTKPHNPDGLMWWTLSTVADVRSWTSSCWWAVFTIVSRGDSVCCPPWPLGVSARPSTLWLSPSLTSAPVHVDTFHLQQPYFQMGLPMTVLEEHEFKGVAFYLGTPYTCDRLGPKDKLEPASPPWVQEPILSKY